MRFLLTINVHFLLNYFLFVNAQYVGTCPKENDLKKVTFLVDASDCSVYYMCDWGKPIKRNCGAGFIWHDKVSN